MSVSEATFRRLNAIPGAQIIKNQPLSRYTRFAIGGPAALLFDAAEETAFLAALAIMADTRDPKVIIGGGTNLIVSDAGFDGVVLRFRGAAISRQHSILTAQAGADLQSVVDASIAHGLQGLESMTGIPGFLGGAVYGNAGAYGRSIHQMAVKVRFANASGHVHEIDNAGCEFGYRTSIFKKRKDWVVLSAHLQLTQGDPSALARSAAQIRTVRDAKYPPEMKCAGSIFKNLFVDQLPAAVQHQLPATVVREGKVPSAWFLEQVGAKGLRRGDIQVATYHANLIYNDGAASASDLVHLIQELKHRVQQKFHFEIEEEVQYIGEF